jgi:hypothetical protein
MARSSTTIKLIVRQELTSELLKSVVHYDETTGIFTRLVSTTPSVKIGDECGSINSDGYVQIGVLGKKYRAHRLAWLYAHGVFPGNRIEIDHINGNRTDNRIANLRAASKSQNLQNQRRYKNNTSGFKGVSFNGKHNKWVATIGHNRKCLWIGYYDTPELAHLAYASKARELFGEFARAA